MRYRPEEIAILETYLERAFPLRRREHLLPGRSRPSIQKRLNQMRRQAGTLYRIRDFEERGRRP